jgi:hypothetical protein
MYSASDEICSAYFEWWFWNGLLLSMRENWLLTSKEHHCSLTNIPPSRLCTLPPILWPLLSYVSVPCLTFSVSCLTYLFLAYTVHCPQSHFSVPCIPPCIPCLRSLFLVSRPLYPVSRDLFPVSRPPVSRDLFPVSPPPFSVPFPYQHSSVSMGDPIF